MTAKDFRLNKAFDADFLRLFLAGDYQAFDAWEPDEVIEKAGVGAIEIQQWIAAGSAAKAFESRSQHARLLLFGRRVSHLRRRHPWRPHALKAMPCASLPPA